MAKYSEGDWFCVPLRSHGYGLGLVARASPSGILLGYFFNVKTNAVPTPRDFDSLTSADAVLIARFGDSGLNQGDWLIIGRDPEWDRMQWPVPVFTRHEQLTGRTFEIFYGEDPQVVVGQQLLPPGSPDNGPRDSLFGAGAVEKALTRLLD